MSFSRQPFKKPFPNYSGRNNPHPNRVTHLKGLLDLPVCVVRDNMDRPSYRRRSRSLWDLKNGSSLPGGLSPNYYNDYQINTSLQNPLQNQAFSKNFCVSSQPQNCPNSYGNIITSRLPVAVLPISQPRRHVPQPDTIRGLQYFTGMRNYSVREKPSLGGLVEGDAYSTHLPRMYGDQVCHPQMHIPISSRKTLWKDELSDLTGTVLSQLQESARNDVFEHVAQTVPPCLQPPRYTFRENDRKSIDDGASFYSARTGRTIPPSNHKSFSRPLSLIRPKEIPPILPPSPSFDSVFLSYELQVFNMICSILQTTDTHAVQHWLMNASEREKSLVTNLLCSALANQNAYFGGNSCPYTSREVVNRRRTMADECMPTNVPITTRPRDHWDLIADSAVCGGLTPDPPLLRKETRCCGAQTDESFLASSRRKRGVKRADEFESLPVEEEHKKTIAPWARKKQSWRPAESISSRGD